MYPQARPLMSSIEAGGGDLVIIYNSGRFRMNGHGSLAGLMPYGSANDTVVEMAKDVLPVVKHTPVIAGVCGTDPYKDMPRFLAQLRGMGFAVSLSEHSSGGHSEFVPKAMLPSTSRCLSTC